MSRAPCPQRSDFPVLVPIATRWMDNDIYGHVNNAAYYSFFDTAVNGHLIAQGALDIHNGDVIGLVVETQCTYFSAVAFPDILHVGIRTERIGTSSIVYGVALFAGDREKASAAGRFVHVYTDRTTRRPVDIPTPLLTLAKSIAS